MATDTMTRAEAPEQGPRLTENENKTATTAEHPSISALPLAAGASALLAACGGGGDDAAEMPEAGGERASAQAVVIGDSTKPGDHDAWRFLTQATFGPTTAEIKSLKDLGYMSWLSRQYNQASRSTVDLVTVKREKVVVTNKPVHYVHCISALWDQFLAGPDQLRQRVAFALSEIFVVSMRNMFVQDRVYSAASFYDHLARNAFGSFRTLIEGVCKHPAMGLYLSHFRNRKPINGRIPDQNFARELMQLFTIGLYELNMDGSEKKTVDGKLTETYTPLDVEVMSHVFTGWTWSDGFNTSHNNTTAANNTTSLGVQTSFMVADNDWHSRPDQFPKGPQGQVTLLKSTFTPSGSAETDLKNALDILLAHPNVAPFIAKQLIQRLVTSNPSPAYVQRVATAFKSSGYSMTSLVEAVLLDTEARDVAAVVTNTTYGKVREPILRVTSFLRAFGATVSPAQKTIAFFDTSLISHSSSWAYVLQALGQAPMMSPSVFNYFRPGYEVPGSETAKQKKVLPEMQLATEAAVAAWVRLVERMVRVGYGRETEGTTMQYTYGTYYYDGGGLEKRPCMQPNYTAEFNLAGNSAALVDAVGAKLLGGKMSTGLREHLIKMCDAIIPPGTTPTDQKLISRVWCTVFLTLVSAEYLVQK